MSGGFPGSPPPAKATDEGHGSAFADSAFQDFPARAYLEKYYGTVGRENAAMLRAIIDYLAGVDTPTETVIEVGGGPSLFSLMAIAADRRRPFRQVTFTDIAPGNLREIELWLEDDPGQFDYGPVLAWLARETASDAGEVAWSLRKSRWELVPFDWREPPPDRWRHGFDVVSSHYFAESATSSEAELIGLLGRLPRLARPGALILLSCMCRSPGYVLAGRDFPAFSIDEHSIGGYLERAGVRLSDPLLRTTPAEDPASQPGYEGLLFIGGRLGAPYRPPRAAPWAHGARATR